MNVLSLVGASTSMISITNLAERHLRHPSILCTTPYHYKPISITNLAERHLRRELVFTGRPPQLLISITNLAERHLRRAEAMAS